MRYIALLGQYTHFLVHLYYLIMILILTLPVGMIMILILSALLGMIMILILTLKSTLGASSYLTLRCEQLSYP
jgi:hypothetical protein